MIKFRDLQAVFSVLYLNFYLWHWNWKLPFLFLAGLLMSPKSRRLPWGLGKLISLVWTPPLVHVSPSSYPVPSIISDYLKKQTNNDVLTDTADTFRLGPGRDLSLIGNFTVVKEKDEIHVQRAALIQLQRDKNKMRSCGSYPCFFQVITQGFQSVSRCSPMASSSAGKYWAPMQTFSMTPA